MAQPPVTTERSPAQVEEDRLQLTYYLRDELMRQRGYAEQEATAVGEACALALARLEGNELAAALSAFRQQERRRRDQAIRAELRTGNASEVARKYGITMQHVYRLAAQR